MYTACLWCAAPLGRNEVIEAFPVGRRLAFDEAKGRLWVVCRKCERWNLTPLEVRGEAIEACERAYRATRARIATDQIGMAKVREGLELVRIGRPLRPEFAAWRYGDQFGRRRRWSMAVEAVGTAVFSAVSIGLATTLGVPLGTGSLRRAREGVLRTREGALLTVDGRTERVSMLLADRARMARGDDTLRLAIPQSTSATEADAPETAVEQVLGDGDAPRVYAMPAGLHRRDWTVLEGAAARDALARLLPAVNRAGGQRDEIADAVRRSETTDGDRVARALRAVSRRVKPLHEIDVTTRLMLEMALHEDDERRWLEGELAELAARWQEAEAIAAIAESLTARPREQR